MVYFKRRPLRVYLFGIIFSPTLIPTLAVLVLLPVLIALGCWQLDRAAQKRMLEKEFSKQHLFALSLTQIEKLPLTALRYQPIEVRGYFDNSHTFLLDNKTYQQKVGYQVLTPFVIKDSLRRIIINRGFIASANRKVLPAIPEVKGIQTIRGLIALPSKSFLLKSDILTENWPLRIQATDLIRMAQLLHSPLYPFLILQQEKDATGLIRDWHPITFPAYRHTGYAVQWFALAITLTILYIVLNTKRNKA